MALSFEGLCNLVQLEHLGLLANILIGDGRRRYGEERGRSPTKKDVEVGQGLRYLLHNTQEHLIASRKTEFGLNQVQAFHYNKAGVAVRKLPVCSDQLGFRIGSTRQARHWVSYEQGLRRRRGPGGALVEGAHPGDRARNEI